MNTAELLQNDKTFEDMIFFIQLVRMSKDMKLDESARMTAGNFIWSWECELLKSGFTDEQLDILKAVI